MLRGRCSADHKLANVSNSRCTKRTVTKRAGTTKFKTAPRSLLDVPAHLVQEEARLRGHAMRCIWKPPARETTQNGGDGTSALAPSPGPHHDHVTSYDVNADSSTPNLSYASYEHTRKVVEFCCSRDSRIGKLCPKQCQIHRLRIDNDSRYNKGLKEEFI